MDMDTTLLVAIEGCDGAGKATQSALLLQHFVNEGKTVSSVSFPRYKQTAGGYALYEALKGSHAKEYDFANVDPHAASLFYAADRKESSQFLVGEIFTHDVLIFDRYVESNMIHQGGKFSTEEGKKSFGEWVLKLEYEMLALPKPHFVVYLDLPFEVAMLRTKERARAHGALPDAVEAEEKYVRDSYLAGKFYAKLFNWISIPGVTESGRELSPQEIHEQVVAMIERRLCGSAH